MNKDKFLDALFQLIFPNYNFTIAHKGLQISWKVSKLIVNQEEINLDFLQILNQKMIKLNWKFHLTSQNIFNQENGGL